MADITKIKGSYISDIKARKSINSLYKYYSNLIRESNTQIKVLDDYNEFKDVITDTITRHVNVIIENLEPGIYVCPDYTVNINIRTKKLTGAYDTIYTSENSCNVIYVNKKDDTHMIFIYNNIETTLYYSTDTANYRIYKKPLVLNTDNEDEYTPVGDYNPTTKKYVDNYNQINVLDSPVINIKDLDVGLYVNHKNMEEFKLIVKDINDNDIDFLVSQDKKQYILNILYKNNEYMIFNIDNKEYKYTFASGEQEYLVENTNFILYNNNEIEYEPISKYNPTTKKYVDTKVNYESPISLFNFTTEPDGYDEVIVNNLIVGKKYTLRNEASIGLRLIYNTLNNESIIIYETITKSNIYYINKNDNMSFEMDIISCDGNKSIVYDVTNNIVNTNTNNIYLPIKEISGDTIYVDIEKMIIGVNYILSSKYKNMDIICISKYDNDNRIDIATTSPSRNPQLYKESDNVIYLHSIDNYNCYTLNDDNSITVKPCYLSINNNEEYNPVEDYNPSTKKYVDDLSPFTIKEKNIVMDCTMVFDNITNNSYIVDQVFSFNINKRYNIYLHKDNDEEVVVEYTDINSISKNELYYHSQKLLDNDIYHIRLYNNSNNVLCIDIKDNTNKLSIQGFNNIRIEEVVFNNIDDKYISSVHFDKLTNIPQEISSLIDNSDKSLSNDLYYDLIYNRIDIDLNNYNETPYEDANKTNVWENNWSNIHVFTAYSEGVEKASGYKIASLNRGLYGIFNWSSYDSLHYIDVVVSKDGTNNVVLSLTSEKYLKDDLITFNINQDGSDLYILYRVPDGDLTEEQTSIPITISIYDMTDKNLSKLIQTNNNIPYETIGDYNPASKKYADSFGITQIYGTEENPIVIEKLVSGWYKTSGKFKYFNSEETLNNTDALISIAHSGNKLKIYKYTTVNGIQITSLNFTDKSTSSLYIDMETINAKLNNALSKNNVIEFTPTKDYNPATKKYVDVTVANSKKNQLVTDTITDNVLTLTTDIYQTVNMVDGTTIVLPTVSDTVLEIHLIFDTTSPINITLPTGVKWEKSLTIEADKRYEIIFTKYGSNWNGKYIVYS